MNRTPIHVLFAALLVLAGCLEIDGQDVHIRYDTEADRIDAMFVHRGLFAEGGNGSSEDPMAKALEDITEAKRTGEFTFWNNWPLSCNPTRDYDAVRDALIAHLDVENGGLFTDPQGVLGAYQFVRIHRASAFLKKVNTLLELALQKGAATGIKLLGEKHVLDVDTKDLLRDFVRSGEQMLRIEKGRVELRLPLSAADHQWFKGAIHDMLLEHLPRDIVRRQVVAQRREDGGPVTDTKASEGNASIAGGELRDEIGRAPSFRFLWDNEVTIGRTVELTTVGIGVAGADELHVTKARGGLYHDALLEKLRERDEPIDEGLPDQELQRRFDDFRTRDAKLPELLALKRG